MIAKEMFEKLGDNYSFDERDNLIEYVKFIQDEDKKLVESLYIYFDIDDKCYWGFDYKKENNFTQISISIDSNLHIIITQQMKELGWIE